MPRSIVNDAPIAPAFNVEVLHTHAQLAEGTLSTDAVVSGPAIMVVHNEVDGSFGDILGATFIEPGTHTGIEVALEGDITNRVWPMLHQDNGVVVRNTKVWKLTRPLPLMAALPLAPSALWNLSEWSRRLCCMATTSRA